MSKKYDNSKVIRDLLLKTVGKDPEKFCYYLDLLEAKQSFFNEEYTHKIPLKKEVIDRLYNTNLKKITDC